MGEVTERKICRLCLKVVSKNDYEIVEEKLVMSKTIFVNLNWRISENPIICYKCSEELQKFDDFKSSCLTTDEHIKCAAKDKLGAVDLWHIEYGNRQTPLEQNQICRFCLKLIKGDKYFKLDEKDVPLMLQKCVPELALSMVREPVICKSCLYVLEGMFKFVTSCLGVEEIINNYRDYDGPNSNVKINLYDVLQFSKIKKESDSDKIPVEELMYDDEFEEAVVKSEKAENEEFQVKCEISVKDEPLVYERELEYSVKNDTEGMFRFVTSCSGVDETINNHETKGLNVNDKENLYKVLQFTKIKEKSDSDEMSVEKLMNDNEFQEAAVQSDKVEDEELQVKSEISLKDEPLGFENELKHAVKNKDVELKSETHLKLEEGIVMMQSRITTELSEQRMSNLDEELLGPHTKQEFGKKRDKVSTYQCEYCSFHTKYQSNLKLHVLSHEKSSEETMHKCDFCSYRTKNKYTLKDHLLIHTEPPETTVYKCYSCSYLTKYKSNFKRHVLTHRDPSAAVITYKCASCSHETKSKSSLRIHLLAHKVSSEVTMHKCDSCSYQTKYASCLKNHALKHKDPSEVTMHKCNSCSFQTKHSSYLKTHLLQHKDPSEVTMHKCDSCSFQTKYAFYLKTHLLTHMDPSEVTMHKCNLCSYQTKHASNLKTHLMYHKDPSEVKVYTCDLCHHQSKTKSGLRKHLPVHEGITFKCDFCLFRTYHKSTLKKHALTHKAPSEVTMYKCVLCSYQTKYKDNVQYHQLCHKNSSEVSMYKCSSCSYQAKRKHHLQRHLLTHKNTSDVIMYKCEVCSYETRYKPAFKKHLLKH